MKIYKINVLHGAPKDSWINIYGFFLAKNEEEVYEYVKEELEYWDDNTENENFTIYDDDYNEIGTETFKEKMLRIKGQINDEDDDLGWDDAYYGITAYGWEDCGEVTLEEIGVLKKFNLILNKK